MKIASQQHESLRILLVEDDMDDRLLIREALDAAGLRSAIEYLEDGEALLKHLDRDDQSRPELILLDLNMPKIDGREVLRTLKQKKELKDIPVVILTTSSSQDDVNVCYKLGANSFVTKPPSFEGLVETMRSLSMYWSKVVKLPTRGTLVFPPSGYETKPDAGSSPA